MLTSGIFSGRVIKTQDLPGREVQYGPLTIPKTLDPVEDIINRTTGKIPYEANGLVHIDPSKIELLGS
jgi:hypothetical protein